MDKLYDKQREQVQQISVEHTRKIFGGSIGLMFYDVTSLYFETGIHAAKDIALLYKFRWQVEFFFYDKFIVMQSSHTQLMLNC